MNRLKKQGFFNYYRKPFLLINGIIFFSLWLFTKPLFPLSEMNLDLMEGFGSLFIIIGVLGRIYSSLTIASFKDSKVVSTEMYSVVRHPLYFFSFLMIVGLGLLFGRLDLLAYLIVFFLVCFYSMMIGEEKFLKDKFGKEYEDYMKKTPRFIPDFRLWDAREKMEINMRLVTKTLLDASLALLVIPLIEIVEFIVYLIK